MKKRTNYLFILLAFLAIQHISCKKSGSSKKAKTNTELLTQAPWKFDKVMSNGFDVSSLINDCYKDNVATFAAAGTGSSDEGATKCNSGDPQTQSFLWSFGSNETKLSVDAAVLTGQSGDFTIIKLTETQLVLEGDFSSTTAQFYFKH